MNPHTGELAMLREGEDRAGFERLPGRLQQMAREKMRRFEQMASAEGYAPGIDKAATVNLRSRSPLAAWAKKKRREKTAAASRRRNRR